MNKILSLVILLFSLPLMVVAGDAVPGGEQGYRIGDYRRGGASSPKYEYRAVWLTTIENLDWPKTVVRMPSDTIRQQRELCAILDSLKALNVNTVLLQTRVRGDVIYPSRLESFSHVLTGVEGRSPGYDPLAFAISECHKRGIAVILDMVFNHSTGLNPMNKLYPYGDDLKYNPWFNVTAPHPDNVYEDWNHDFAPAKKMMIRALNYWLTEYKVDGFRMDLSHGLCGTTYDAMDHITDYYEKGVKAVAEDAYFILEHWGPQMSSERPKLINQGMLCWDNTTNAYYQTAMGWLKDGDSFTNANRDGYVTYCESHDEERAFFKAKQYGNG